MRNLVLVVLALLLFGCSDHSAERKRKTVRFDPNKYETYKPTHALLRVGTNVLTKAKFESLIDIRERALLLSVQRNDILEGKTQKKHRVNREALTTAMLAAAETSFHSEVAFLTWARTNGVVLATEDLVAAERSFLKANGIENCRYDDFVTKNFNKSERSALKERLAIEALGAKARRTYLKDHPVVVSSNEVSQMLATLVTYNENASRTNVAIWARATNFWQQAKAGADFSKLAEENTQDDASSEGGEWGDFSYQDLEQYGLAELVANMKPGDVSSPVEADNGLNVIFLESISNEPRPGSSTGVKRYSLKRIFLLLPETYEIPSFGEAERKMRGFAEQKTMEDFVRSLMKTVVLEYPHGKTIFDVARNMKNMPNPLVQ